MTSGTLQIEHVRDIGQVDVDAVIVAPLFEDDDLADQPELRSLGGSALQQALERKGARASLYDVSLFFGQPSLALMGAGKREELDGFRWSRIAAAASRSLTARSFSHLALVDRGTLPPFQFAQAGVAGAIRGTYDPGIKKTRGDTTRILDRLTLVSTGDSELQDGARIGQIVGESSAMARDLVNLPANELTPAAFAERAEALAGEYGLDVDIIDEAQMRELGMGAILGVAAGSAQPPRVIVLRYGDRDAAVKLALVGKGITFDSGGLSLKPPEGMETMKGDMGGGAAVVAGMVAVARLAPLGISVTGYVGATENMPGGNAMRPGDVLTAFSGETIEVLNTDAEGRLVLADVLSYATSQGATHIVDFATLTGGAVVALGYAASAVMARPAEWGAEVVQAAGEGLERAWQLPLFDDYRRAMDSEVADIKNTGGRAASPLTAGAFLSDFVDGPLWAHVDIAGTAFATKDAPFRPTGGTGEGVATIVALARRLAR